MQAIQVLKTKFLKILQSKHLKLLMFLGLLVTVKASFADDPLSGAEDVVKDAYNGSIKTYLYVGEAVAAVMVLMFTRNIKALGGVGAVAIFLNVVAKLAGI